MFSIRVDFGIWWECIRSMQVYAAATLNPYYSFRPAIAADRHVGNLVLLTQSRFRMDTRFIYDTIHVICILYA